MPRAPKRAGMTPETERSSALPFASTEPEHWPPPVEDGQVVRPTHIRPSLGLEAVTKYRRFRHGEAIAYGMLTASRLAVSRGALSPAHHGELAALIVQLGPLPPVGDLSAAEVVAATERDKKVIAGRLHFVLPATIGATTTVTDVTPEELTRALVSIGLAP